MVVNIQPIRLIRDREKGVWRGEEREIIYLLLHPHHQNDSCITMGSNKSHFNVSLIVTRQCPQTTSFEKKEVKQSQSKVPLLTSLTPYCEADHLTTALVVI